MKFTVKKIAAAVAGALTTLQLMGINAMAAAASSVPQTGYTEVVNPIIELLNDILWPIIAVVAAVGTLYCVVLGVKFAKAEEPQEREKAKTHLKNAIIGFVLIFVLMVVLKLMTPLLSDWVRKY